MTVSLYLKCKADDIGDFVLLTGDPARVAQIGSFFDSTSFTMQNREFTTITGDYQGRRFSGVSSGIGAPSAAIAIEELAQLGVKAIVRVGTMMGVTAQMGSFVISTGAVRHEGTSEYYLPMTYPAIPDWSLANYIHQSALKSDLPVQVGLTATYDAFYPKMAPALVGRGLPDSQQLRDAGVLSLDMETSLLYILGMNLKLPVLSMCLVTNIAEPFSIIDADERETGENRLIQTILDGLSAWSDTL